jgi:NAD(P)-dependent dehydrogenase (short-subunit alcohol dehydrogenase family)
MRLAGKVVIVTGAAAGMGLAMATRFAAEGASIVAGDWNGDRLKEAVATIKASGGKIVGLQGNIADRASAELLVDTAVSEFGRLDVLVNNAGIMDYMQGVAELEDDLWNRVLGVNLNGPMFTMRRAVPIFQKQGSGNIVNIASAAGVGGGSAGCAYTVSKHGVVGLTKQTAWRYAKEGIRCNAICPGAVHTKIEESMPMDKINKVGFERAFEFNALAPAVLEASDIANLALYLASDESKMISGTVTLADAGWHAV